MTDARLEDELRAALAEAAAGPVDMWPSVQRKLRRRARPWRHVAWVASAAAVLTLSAGALAMSAPQWVCKEVHAGVCATFQKAGGDGASGNPPMVGAVPLGGSALALTPPPPFAILLPHELPVSWSREGLSYRPRGTGIILSQGLSPSAADDPALTVLGRRPASFLRLRYGAGGVEWIDVVETAAADAPHAVAGAVRVERDGTVAWVLGHGAMSYVPALADSLR